MYYKRAITSKKVLYNVPYNIVCCILRHLFAAYMAIMAIRVALWNTLHIHRITLLTNIANSDSTSISVCICNMFHRTICTSSIHISMLIFLCNHLYVISLKVHFKMNSVPCSLYMYVTSYDSIGQDDRRKRHVGIFHYKLLRSTKQHSRS